MNLKPVLCIALVITILGCKKQYEIDLVNSCAIYPLAIGNTWVYKTTFYDSKGSVDSVKTATTELTSTSVHRGDTYFNIDSFYYPIKNKDCNTINLYDANADSVITITNTSPANDFEVYEYKYSGPAQNCRYGTTMLINKDRTIVKGYNCFKVEFRFTSCSGVYYRKRYYYISEGVGMVKTEAYNIVRGTPVLADMSELVSYKLQK